MLMGETIASYEKISTGI